MYGLADRETGLRPGDSSMVGHEVLLNKLEVLTLLRSLAWSRVRRQLLPTRSPY